MLRQQHQRQLEHRALPAGSRSRGVLWIQGWAANPSIWKPCIEHLRDYEHLFVDFAQCDSPSDLESAIDRQIAALPDVTTDGSAAPMDWCIVGWSLGALLLLQSLLRTAAASSARRSSVRSICIVGGTLCFTSAHSWPKRAIERMRARMRADPAQCLRQFNRLMFSDREWSRPEIRDVADQLSTDWTPNGLDAGLQLLSRIDLRSLWSHHVHALPPLRWLHGQCDAVCPIAAVPHHWSASARFEALPCGHAPFITQPRLFASRLRELIECR